MCLEGNHYCTSLIVEGNFHLVTRGRVSCGWFGSSMHLDKDGKFYNGEVVNRNLKVWILYWFP